MTADETNKYFNIYENYIKDLIRIRGDNPAHYSCSTRNITDSDDDYTVGGLWPRYNPFSKDCDLWPRLPSLDNDPNGLIYMKMDNNYYIINVINPMWENKIMIISYRRSNLSDSV